ncbi:MAG: hypothetical protein CM1200mP2_27620 [Planctomycetaceae bacterium]|nr:MAG: hypothetical protein CM1200mP2_27620 [Planctomycetaceae bacterium]
MLEDALGRDSHREVIRQTALTALARRKEPRGSRSCSSGPVPIDPAGAGWRRLPGWANG